HPRMIVSRKSANIIKTLTFKKKCATIKPSLINKQGFGESIFTLPFFIIKIMAMNGIEQVVGGSAMRIAPALPYPIDIYSYIYYINFCSLYRHMLP
ncbi:hypothetical protein ACFLXU_02675, partial [Chloroflexota bacterium]